MNNEFELSENLTCFVDDTSRIVHCNHAWDRAARDNGVEQAVGVRLRGTSLLDYIPGVLQYHYSKLLERAREKRTIVFTDYECNTPDLFRSFNLSIVPVPESPLLALVHTLLKKSVIPYPVCSPATHEYGFESSVTMCAQCRRSKRLRDNIWEWVPDFVRNRPPRVTHGICDNCIALYS